MLEDPGPFHFFALHAHDSPSRVGLKSFEELKGIISIIKHTVIQTPILIQYAFGSRFELLLLSTTENRWSLVCGRDIRNTMIALSSRTLLGRACERPPLSRNVFSRNIQEGRRYMSRCTASVDDPGLPTSAPVTDREVPEAHLDLHNFLYGKEDAEASHGSSSSHGGEEYEFRDGEDDGNTIIRLHKYLAARDGERPVGVFAVYDDRRNLQYVSYSRNVVLALRSIRSRVEEDKCEFVRVMVFANRAMQSRAALEQEAQRWLAEAGTLPPGNAADRARWEGFDLESMSPQEAAAYKEKKTKLQKAMGDRTVTMLNETTVPQTSEERRESLRAAFEKDDWSAVVDEQTIGTIENNSRSSEAKVTPFAQASVHRSVANWDENGAPPVMSNEAVDQALDDVRPYLMADGGNVEVVAVDNGVVSLRLQGACGSCPSSNATMKMGIERSLKAKFGDQLVDVVAVGNAENGNPSATKEGVDMHLNMLRGAVAAYGGSIEVETVAQGVAIMRYSGPIPIGYGIVAAVRDKFPDLVDVVVLDMDSGERIQF